MQIQKFSAPAPSPAAGFVVTDLDGAVAADGIVRCARKVLQDGARTMARSRTYAWALLSQPRSGASAGISSLEDRDGGIEALLAAVEDRTSGGALVLDPGKGVTAADLEPVRAGDPRHAGDDATLLAAGLVTAAASVRDLSGCRVALEGPGAWTLSAAEAFRHAGASVVALGDERRTAVAEDGLDADVLAQLMDGSDVPTGVIELAASDVFAVDADVVVCGSRLGVIDHQVAEQLGATVVVPHSPAPVTAKGLAVAERRGVNVLADFLTTAGPLQRFLVEGPDAQLEAAVAHASRLGAGSLAHERGPYLGACFAAEEFLATWCDELPFGRPLA